MPTLLRVRRIGRRRLLLWIRRVRRCAAIALRWPLRRTLRHERVSRLARRRLPLTGRRVALLRRRIAITGPRRRVAIRRRRTVALRRAVAVSRPGRPARRKHRAARPAARRRSRRGEDDLTSSLVRAESTETRNHRSFSVLVFGEGHEAKSARFARVLMPHHDLCGNQNFTARLS